MSLQLRPSLLCVRKQSEYPDQLFMRTDSTCIGTKLHGGIPKFQVRHARIREFLSGGGGTTGLMARKQPGQCFFLLLLLLFFRPQLTVLQFTEGVQRFYYTILFQGSRGGPTFSREVQHFPGGSNFFQGGGGVKMVISIKTHITCHFPGGSGPPFPPLDPHMCAVDDVIYNY